MFRSLCRHLARGALVAVFLFPPSSLAATGQAALQVSATVLPWAQITTQPRIDHYHLDADDVRRGYVDLVGALELVWRANSAQCLVLSVLAMGNTPQFEQLLELHLCLPPPSTAASSQTAVDLRLPVTPRTEPGTFPLTLQVVSTLL